MVFIYILKLWGGRYYVGMTNNLNFDIDTHFNTEILDWTKLYKPIQILEFIPDCDENDIDKYVVKLMEKHGILYVRGGSYTQFKLGNASYKIWQTFNKKNKCHYCGELGHVYGFCNKSNLEPDRLYTWYCKVCNKNYNNIKEIVEHEKQCVI